jgi:high-affinity iron transporter
MPPEEPTTVGATFVIALREGLEATLIVSILLAYLRQSGRAERGRLIWWGAVSAVVASIAIGSVIFFVGAEFDGTGEQLFEGLVTLSAVAVLTWMIFWMRRQGGRLRGELHGKVDTALSAGGFALASLAFFSVLREGVETALFFYAAAKGTAAVGGNEIAQVVGAALGLAVAAFLGVLLYRGGIRLDLRSFFRVTGVVLVVVAAGLLAFSIHELQEAGVLPVLTATAYDIARVLPDDAGIGAVARSLFGYHATPSWLEVVGWISYLVLVGGLFLRSHSVAVPAPARATTGTTA